jgi:hypothetical protein
MPSIAKLKKVLNTKKFKKFHQKQSLIRDIAVQNRKNKLAVK